MQTALVLRGKLKDERTIELDEPVRNVEADVEVIVRPVGPAKPAPLCETGTVRLRPVSLEEGDERLTDTRKWLLELASDAEQAAPELPRDMAERHDHYAHGKPLP